MKSPAPATIANLPLAKFSRRVAAFTMIEIALALAVIGFALVAIVGVLPLGLETQKQNREDTIIDHDANYLLDAIKNGSRGADDLRNYVYEIRHNIYEYDLSGTRKFLRTDIYRQTGNTSPFDGRIVDTSFRPFDGSRIIGLLGLPKYQRSDKGPDYFISNNVVAYVRALSGAVTEKSPQTNQAVLDLAFNYKVTIENMPMIVPPFTNVLNVAQDVFHKNLQANLHEVRLLYRWPVRPNGDVGTTGREVYRTQVGGRIVEERPAPGNSNLVTYYFQPSTYRKQ
jgi:type II secretory pathway pseudopilin PulG